MLGAICTWDIAAHPVVTVRCFGWRIFSEALFADQEQTFLPLIHSSGFIEPSIAKIPALLCLVMAGVVLLGCGSVEPTENVGNLLRLEATDNAIILTTTASMEDCDLTITPCCEDGFKTPITKHWAAWQANEEHEIEMPEGANLRQVDVKGTAMMKGEKVQIEVSFSLERRRPNIGRDKRIKN